MDLGAAADVQEADAAQVLHRRVGNLGAVFHPERVDASQVRKGSIRDGGLAAAAHVELVDAPQVRKCDICDGHLVALAHVELVDAPQVRKRRIGDGGLIAAAHVERVDAPQVRKRSVRDGGLVAAGHVELVDAPQVRKSGVRDGGLVAAMLSLWIPSRSAKSASVTDLLFHMLAVRALGKHARHEATLPKMRDRLPSFASKSLHACAATASRHARLDARSPSASSCHRKPSTLPSRPVPEAMRSTVSRLGLRTDASHTARWRGAKAARWHSTSQ